MRIIFESLEQLVEAVTDGDVRTAFLVQHRGRDYYCLAESEVEAIAAVAESSGYQAGHVPLDLIVAAARKAAAAVQPPPAEVETESPSPLTDVEMNGMNKAELVKAARQRGIDLSGDAKKIDFIEALRKHRNESESPAAEAESEPAEAESEAEEETPFG
jgi:CheY-like chemotaxis protein